MKDIKDYLHLYLGSKVSTVCEALNNGEPQELTVSINNMFDILYRYKNSKLILRPLSDMTEKEVTDLIKMITVPVRHDTIRIMEIKENHIWYIDGEMWHGDGVSEVYDKYLKFNELSADQFAFLLSRGFDLFGLIDAWLAIDKTTLK